MYIPLAGAGAGTSTVVTCATVRYFLHVLQHVIHNMSGHVWPVHEVMMYDFILGSKRTHRDFELSVPH